MLRRWVFALTSVGTVHLVALAAIVGWAVAFVVFVARFSGPLNARGDPVGGDLLAFYTAGRIVLDGQGDELYDLHTQCAVQRAVVRRDDYRALAAYVNPPTVAALFAPLAGLPFVLAYVIYSTAALAALLLGMRLLRPHVPALHAHWGTVVVAGLSFYPIIRTITGGQNTAISFLLMAATYAALRGGRSRVAGIALGLLFYKPQFALVLSALLLFRRQYVCVAIAVAVAIGHYVVGALVCGVWWPLNMHDALAAFDPLEFRYNGATQASWIGFFEYALPRSLGSNVGMAYVGLTVVLLLWLWRRADPHRESFGLHWAAAVGGTLLVSPHTQYYDTGLVLLPVLLVLNWSFARRDALGGGVRLALLLAYALFPIYPVAKSLGWQPVILLPVFVLLWTARLLEGDCRAVAHSDVVDVATIPP